MFPLPFAEGWTPEAVVRIKRFPSFEKLDVALLEPLCLDVSI